MCLAESRNLLTTNDSDHVETSQLKIDKNKMITFHMSNIFAWKWVLN